MTTLPPSPGTPSRLRIAGRALVLSLVLAWLGGGILLRQGLSRGELGGVSLRALPRWKMFSTVGLGMTQVRYLVQQDDGRWQELDRFATLHTAFLDQPRSIWLVQGREEGLRLGQRLCRTLGPGTALRMQARTATRKGWKTVANGSADLCTLAHIGPR